MHLFRLFRKPKPRYAELWVRVEWSKEAEELCSPVGRLIVWYSYGDKIDVELYSDARVEQIRKAGIPVVFSSHPCVTRVPKFATILGRVRE